MAAEPQQHRTSLAIWDIPSTAVAGERFTVKAGVKSSADCDLRGRRIEACDSAGAVVASGTLGAAPWPDTGALYWTELSLSAPAKPGMAALSVRFAAAGLAPPHRDAAAQFVVMVVPPPEHTVTIQVVAQQTAAPIGGAEIRLGPYRATTAASGSAAVRVPKGRFDLHIWKAGFDAAPRPVAVDGDAAVKVEAAILPDDNADRAWRG